MGEVKECFRCGTMVAMADNKFFDVERSDGSSRPREACSKCYYEAVAHEQVLASHGGKTYVCRPRTLQRDLFGRTFRHLTRDGGKHV